MLAYVLLIDYTFGERTPLRNENTLFVTEFSTTKRFIDPDEKKMAAASNLVKAKKFKKKLDVSIMYTSYHL